MMQNITRLAVSLGIALSLNHPSCIAADSDLTSTGSTAVVTFERDLMAVLSKGGCNAGTCHGNVNGKGGLFLSLRGQDPAFDYRQLVRSGDGRRINPMSPKDSLLLLKATAEMAHQGGKRFDHQSPEYQIFQRWIETGLAEPDDAAPRVTKLDVTPDDQVIWEPVSELQLQVTATFSDGTQRDVTRLAVYEPSDPLVQVTVDGMVQFENPGLVTILVRYLDGQYPVRVAYRRPTQRFNWSQPSTYNFIDEIVFQRLKELRVNPSTLADDHVFLRRICLDLLGSY